MANTVADTELEDVTLRVPQNVREEADSALVSLVIVLRANARDIRLDDAARALLNAKANTVRDMVQQLRSYVGAQPTTPL